MTDEITKYTGMKYNPSRIDIWGNRKTDELELDPADHVPDIPKNNYRIMIDSIGVRHVLKGGLQIE